MSESTPPTGARPKLGLAEMMAKKGALRETGIDKTHLGCVSTSQDGTISYQPTKLPQAEQGMLAKLWVECGGDPGQVAARVPSEYGMSATLLKQNPPPNAKVFAAQCVEGAYHFDEVSGETSDKAALVSRLPPQSS